MPSGTNWDSCLGVLLRSGDLIALSAALSARSTMKRLMLTPSRAAGGFVRRSKDESDLERLQKDITAALQITERFGGQQTIPSGVLLDFLQKELDPLMRRTAEIGEPTRRFFKALENIRDVTFKSLEGQRDDVKSDIESLKDALQVQFNLFLAQIWRADTPITAEEITPALLCDNTNTVAAVGEFLQRHNPELVQVLYEGSVTLLTCL